MNFKMGQSEEAFGAFSLIMQMDGEDNTIRDHGN